MRPRLGALLTHPIQYYSPWFRHLAQVADLTVYYAHQQTAEGQGRAGFGAGFEWDVPLLDGYDWRWLDNVSSHPGLASFSGCDTPEIVDIVREARFDALLMFGWNRKCFLQAAWGALRSRTPLLVRLDSNLMAHRSAMRNLLKTPLYSAVLPRAGHYLSPGVRTDDYLRRYLVPESRIHRVAHMIDVDRFRRGAQAARATGATRALRATHGVAEDDVVLLFVGKLIPKKRPHLLLEAFRRLGELAPERKGTTRLWIVGDGPLRADLEAAARAQGLAVDFLGFANQSELPEIYATADCLVLPSNGEETWGLVVNEAFACGVPAIVSAEAGCAPDLIFEGRSGWTMTTPDAHHLAGLLLKACSEARDLPRALLDEISATGSYSTGSGRLLEIVAGFGTRT